MCCIQNAQRLHHNKNRSCTSPCGFHMAFISLLNISTGAGALSIWFGTIRKSIFGKPSEPPERLLDMIPSQLSIHVRTQVLNVSQKASTHLAFLSLSLNPLIIIQIQRIFIGASPLASIKGVTLDSPTMSKVCKRLLFNPVQISVHQVSCFLPRISKTVPSNSEVVVGMRTS